jgi:hypothetical protein
VPFSLFSSLALGLEMVSASLKALENLLCEIL